MPLCNSIATGSVSHRNRSHQRASFAFGRISRRLLCQQGQVPRRARRAKVDVALRLGVVRIRIMHTCNQATRQPRPREKSGRGGQGWEVCGFQGCSVQVGEPKQTTSKRLRSLPDPLLPDGPRNPSPAHHQTPALTGSVQTLVKYSVPARRRRLEGEETWNTRSGLSCRTKQASCK